MKEVLIKRIERQDGNLKTIALAVTIRDGNRIYGKVVPLISFFI